MTTTDELLKRIEELEQEQAQLQTQLAQTKEQYQQVTGLFEQFKRGSVSRRAFLTSVTALAGVGFAAGNASAAPDWSNTSGYAGTDAQPLIGVNASSVTSESVSTDDLSIGSPVTSGSVTFNSGAETTVFTYNPVNFGPLLAAFEIDGNSGGGPKKVEKFQQLDAIDQVSIAFRETTGNGTDQTVSYRIYEI